jgi:hypothetical protein
MIKVYEIGLPDHYDDNSNGDCDCDCTIWIATDKPIKQISNDSRIYVKEIEEYNENTPGIDLIIK